MTNKSAARRWAAKAETSHLQCRVGRGGHVWAEYTDKEHTKINPAKGRNGRLIQGSWQIETSCIRCGAEARFLIDKRTGIPQVTGRVKLPEGYAFSDGSGYPMDRFARGIARLELTRRALEGDE